MNIGSPHAARPYRSPLRQRQFEDTRRQIADAIVRKIADNGMLDFSPPEIAKMAGVSERTVYRHFPTQESLFEYVLDQFEAPLAQWAFPKSAKEIADAVEELFPVFDEHAALATSYVVNPAAAAVRRERRKVRIAALNAALDKLLAGREASERRRAQAVVHYLFNSQAWKSMREESGLDGREAGLATGWALRTLLADLAKPNGGPRARPARGAK